MTLTHELIHIAGQRPDRPLDLSGQIGQIFFRPASLVFGKTYEALNGREKFYPTALKVAVIVISLLLAPLTVSISSVGFCLLYISKSHRRLVELVKTVASSHVFSSQKISATKSAELGASPLPVNQSAGAASKSNLPLPSSLPSRTPVKVAVRLPKPPAASPPINGEAPMHFLPTSVHVLPPITEDFESEGNSTPAGAYREESVEGEKLEGSETAFNTTLIEEDFKFFTAEFYRIGEHLGAVGALFAKVGVQSFSLTNLASLVQRVKSFSTVLDAEHGDYKFMKTEIESVDRVCLHFKINEEAELSIAAIKKKLIEIQDA